MTSASHILVVDDQPKNRKLLADILGASGYLVTQAPGGLQALSIIRDEAPDLVLLDVLMPDMNGYEVCKAIRDEPTSRMLPVVMVTSLDATEERIRGLEAGADDFLTKPINKSELIARVKSLLRIKSLYDLVQVQTDELTSLNAGLELRVLEQLTQLDRLRQLKRFFPPHLAEQIVSGDLNDPMQTRRREVTVVMLGLRGFNAFADTSEPEEVMRLLRNFHVEMGRLIEAHGGTLEQFTGSSMIVIFNDPVMVEDPALNAISMTLEMQQCFSSLLSGWRKQGYDFALGVGISHGFATIGAIGDEERASYGVVGRVTNVAARLCEEASAGEILISASVQALTEDAVELMEVEQVNMAGFARAVSVYRVTGMISKLAADSGIGTKKQWPLRIHTLGRFAVEVNGKPLQFSRKAQKKPLDMLRVLVAYGGERVEANTIIEHVWPGSEGDAGKMSFDSNLHRLRKLIDVEEVLLMSEGTLSLASSKCWIDVIALNEVVTHIERASNGAVSSSNDVIEPLTKELLQLYAGHFLESESQEAWVVAARDRWKAKFVRAVGQIGDVLQSRQDWDKAATLFSRALELDNLAEALYRRLMTCYLELGEPTEALNSYRRCRDMLSIVLGVKPSPETEAIRASLELANTPTGVSPPELGTALGKLMSWTHRHAARADLSAIVEIYNATIPSRMVTADLEPVSVESRIDWFEQHQPDFRPLWVAERDGHIAGWLSLSTFYARPAYNKSAELSFYVDEPFRHLGLGSYFLTQAIAYAPSLGIDRLIGFVFGHNQPSQKLMESFGFQRWGKLPGVTRLDRIDRDVIIFGLIVPG